MKMNDNCRRFDGLPVGATAINIPNKLDGRTKFLKNGHWKPTGGMDLNIFLSNTYPVPRNAMIPNWHEFVDGSSKKNRHEIYLNESKKKRIDDSAGVIQVGKKTPKAALTIVSEDSSVHHNEMLEHDGGDHTLIMPLSLSQNVQRITKVYEGRNNHDNDTADGVIGVGSDEDEYEKRFHRTDISEKVIENILDGWEDTPSGHN
jgi:hypothetical protein